MPHQAWFAFVARVPCVCWRLPQSWYCKPVAMGYSPHTKWLVGRHFCRRKHSLLDVTVVVRILPKLAAIDQKRLPQVLELSDWRYFFRFWRNAYCCRKHGPKKVVNWTRKHSFSSTGNNLTKKRRVHVTCMAYFFTLCQNPPHTYTRTTIG